MLCGGVHLCAKTAEKPYSKRFSAFFGHRKIHRNSIKITVDLWRSGRDSNPRTAFDRHTISSRARYDHFDTTAYLNAQQQCSTAMLNSKHHYTKIGREVNTQFSLFRKKETERRSVSFLFVLTSAARARRASGSSRRPPSPAAAPPPAGGTGRRGCCCPSGRRRRGRSRPHSS